MFEKAFGTKMSVVSILICVGIFISFGFASAGTFSTKGTAFDSDGATPLPGTGLSNMVTADPEQPYGYVQCIFAGPDGEIDPPDTDGSTTDDDVLLEIAEYPGQFFTAVGEGYPFSPNGRFFEDFTHALDVGSIIYCRVWNGTSPLTSTHYGDSELYSLAEKEFDDNDFGSWSTIIPISVPGDFDHDGDVDGSDLAIFAGDFGRIDCDQGDICRGDLNNDNDVDGSDLAIFSAYFGRIDCP